MSNERRWKDARLRGAIAALALALLAIGLLTWAPGRAAQETTPTPAATTTAEAAATPVPTGEAPTPAVPSDTSVPATSTLPAGPAEPLPTPTGAPPADPRAVLSILNFYNPSDALVKSDFVNLNGTGVDEVLFTVSGVQAPITAEVTTRVSVLSYDDVYRRWSLEWVSSAITGTAHPLPAANRSAAGGYNGGNLLPASDLTGDAIFAARTTTRDGQAHLYLWRWNSQSGEGERLKMVVDGAEQDALFSADLDVNLVDIDDDNIYEVVADNVADVRVWRWDGARFALEEAR